ncbi:hypothetical protein JCGZ_14799 [Jatropha curcas]|uniref:GED domain-containing protein n=1 Tax=Jatropha curcas TaxID=180498 RepID=A0A067KIA6_JATCU|nr:hypothetical protein JCGZ_14799 [Jatropha curcas]
MVRRPADPEEELRWMSQEVRGYVEAVLNSLAANVPKAVVLCQVEKAKEDMLNQLYSSVSAQSTARIEELLQEDQNVKRRRERYQKQSSLLSKLTRQLRFMTTGQLLLLIGRMVVQKAAPSQMVHQVMTGEQHLMQLQMVLWTMVRPGLHLMAAVGITMIQHRMVI